MLKNSGPFTQNTIKNGVLVHIGDSNKSAIDLFEMVQSLRDVD
ncbi:hypothetical protein M233_06160 [Xylella fastidiosa subsp. multiplex Griffin-1]|nr:hypothetical protein M233_06160 [Xylella fastidiosa subsp. multiplex Griffin-1]